MDFKYISGFFDADGSISLLSIHKNEQKTIQISFSNNELSILENIQDYIRKEIQINGFISRKKAQNKNHSDNYELKYTRKGAIELIRNLHSIHPRKKHRIAVILKYYEKITIRNGKYNRKNLLKKQAFNRLFYWSTT